MLMFSRDDSIPQSLSSFFFLNNQKNRSAARSYFGCSRNSNNLYAKDERNLGEWKKKKSLYLHLYFCILFTLFDFCHSRHARLATEWVTRYAQAKQTAAIFPFHIFVGFVFFGGDVVVVAFSGPKSPRGGDVVITRIWAWHSWAPPSRMPITTCTIAVI